MAFKIVFFKENGQYVYLARSANISSTCYVENPYLLGTTDNKQAKYYLTKEDAIKDIMLLRYYHREFLNIRTGVIRCEYSVPGDIKIKRHKEQFESEC